MRCRLLFRAQKLAAVEAAACKLRADYNQMQAQRDDLAAQLSEALAAPGLGRTRVSNGAHPPHKPQFDPCA